MRGRALSGLATVALYFLLHVVLSILEEVFRYDPRVSLLILFPMAKIFGDALMVLAKQVRIHAFVEEWLKESLLFSALAIVAVLAREFWFNALQLSQPPGLVFVAVVAYAVMHSFRRGARHESELS